MKKYRDIKNGHTCQAVGKNTAWMIFRNLAHEKGLIPPLFNEVEEI